MPRDASGKRRETTQEERVRIIQLKSQGYSYKEIPRLAGFPISKTGAERIVKRWEEGRLLQDKPRSSRPKKAVTPQLIEECERNPAAPLRNIARSANVHAATAGRKLRREGYFSFKKAVVSKIADLNKPKRVRWCQERRDWKLQWRKAVFVDETQVPSSGGAGSGRVRRRAGQRMEHRFQTVQQRYGRFSAMFFGAITHGHHSPLVYVPRRTERRHEKDRGGMDARHYIETVVRPVLGPWWKTLPGEGKDYVLVDDGSPAHRAGETEEVFSELGIQQVL
jgi:transposase